MTLDQLLKTLSDQGISLSFQNNELVIRGSEAGITDEIKSLITRHMHALADRLRGKMPADAPNTTIMPVPDSPDGFPLSWFQERLWVYNQKDPEDLSYNIPVVFSVEGSLNVLAFEKSLNLIISRHESIRTVFKVNADGVPRQYIVPHSPISLSPAEVTEAEVGPTIEQMVTHVFDLTSGPLFVPRLIRLGPEHHVFMFNIHHICSDAWSIRGILFKELMQCYAAFCFEQPPRVTPLLVQYRDFSVWQRRQDVSKQLSYWKEHLEGYEDTLRMPTDFPRTPKSGQKSETFTRKYPTAFSKSLEQFSKHHDCTLFISLLAGFGLTAYRYTGKDDLCIGTTVAGRSLVELEPLIGFLVNILPLRMQIDENVTVRQFMEQMRRLTLNGFDNQMVAFEQILSSLEGVNRGQTNALVPLILRHQNFPHAQLNTPLPGNVRFTPYAGAGSSGDGLQAEKADVAARCEMELSYTGDSDGLELSIAYASDLYLRETIDRVLDNHQHILEEMFKNDKALLKDLVLMGDAHRERLTVTWNQNDVPLDEDAAFVTRFEAQAQRTPAHIACHDHEGEWRFAEISRQSNRLANGLIAGGVNPGDVVGVCLDRGAPLLVTLLAIWKAGAAYVPLDPAYPGGYLQQILSDASPKIIVCTSATSAKLSDAEIEIFALDADREFLSAQPDSLPNVAQTAGALAYIMYTSGSTGTPKGVRVPHRQLINWLSGLEACWPFEKGEVIAQKTTMAFAVSVKEIFAGLLNGCPEVFIDHGTVTDTALFVETLAKYGVTRLNLVPSHLMTVIAYLERQGTTLPALRYCITAGEPLTPEIVEAVRTHLPNLHLINNYGCTELNDICYYDVTDYTAKVGFVPIGRPIQNTKLYVLDRQGRLVPEGVPGELHVATLGMADGYHNLPAMTAGSFLPNPFADAPYDRFYNTGDVVKYLPDGNLEYLGRWDFQVKVRGFRVDVRQVEKVLGDFEGMGVRAVMGEGERLVAYYVPADGKPLELNALRGFLQKRLPPYMVPDSFVQLDAMPRLPNGKMNRKALKTSSGQLQQSDGYEAPQTDTEKLLAQIWSEVLEVPVEQIGRRAHFFEIGGHSLAATRVVARLKDRLQLEVGLSLVFELPELCEFGARIDDMAPAESAGVSSTETWTLKVETADTHSGAQSKMLDNRVCLVTGASRGIGQSTARLLARHGAKVAINYLKNEGLAQKVKSQIEREGGVAEVFQADVTNLVQVKRMVEMVETTLGPIDALVANAAIGFPMLPFVEYEWGDFEQKLAGELKAIFYPCQAVLPGMMTRRTGSIVAISSGLSKHAGDGFIAHSSAKAALDAFVRGLAHEAGPAGVRVNTVAPGVVLTDATAHFAQGYKAQAAAAVPLRRNAMPHDIAGAILFFASDLSQYITGCYLPVDGGFTML